MTVELMGMGGAQGTAVVLVVEKEAVAAAVVAVADLSGEEGGRVEPSRLRKGWAGSFPLPKDMTWRCPESGAGEG